MKETEFPTPDSLFIDLPAGIRSILLVQTAQAIESGTDPFKDSNLTKLPLPARLDYVTNSLELGRKLALPYRQAALEFDQRLQECLTQAQKFEKADEIQNAIALYEQNINDGFLASLPYERLRIIYEKQRSYQSAIRVCKRYIEVLQMVSTFWPQYSNIRQIPKYQDIIKKLSVKMKGSKT
jgi:tetratricopeptide (TPR) repeat protein